MDIIKDFMSTPVLSVDVDTTVTEAAKIMREKSLQIKTETLRKKYLEEFRESTNGAHSKPW